jgi:hypothetical protein
MSEWVCKVRAVDIYDEKRFTDEKCFLNLRLGTEYYADENAPLPYGYLEELYDEDNKRTGAVFKRFDGVVYE